MFAFTKKSTEGKHHGLLVRVKAWHSKGPIFEGSVSEPQNESAKNVETKALKYCPIGPKTRAPKIRKRHKIIGLFQALYNKW